ncbi:MAG: redox-regulated ATPase YchF [Thermoanaerobacteraceae bacterium]|nr:redox-regulated ATPase YchF [Thermoanaerobacteraceae bacterium]
MALSCGIVGLPSVGKSTFFKLLTGADVALGTYAEQANIKTADIPDWRIDWFQKLYQPKKTTYAQLELIDIPGLQPEGGSREFLSHVAKTDALVHVVRAFADPQVFHVEGSINPMRDLEKVNSELLLSDLQLVETRIDRITSGKKRTPEMNRELAVMEKLRAVLEEARMLTTVNLQPEEEEVIQHMSFLTDKPMIVVVNVDENQLAEGYVQQEAVQQYCRENDLALLEICAQVEMEINELPQEEREEFMEDLGIKEPGISRLARTVYDTLGLISFITVGKDEVRAWPIKKGSTAREAAGKIHSDIARGFIRAEVVGFEDFYRAGSMEAVKEQDLLRLENKDYIVEDGDVMSFRFNV